MCDARLMPQVTSSRRMDLPGRPAAGPGPEMYTPKLKKVLKSYQAAATTSLMGPTSYQSSWSSPSPPSSSAKSVSSSSSSTSSSCSTSAAAQQQPPTKVPLIVPADESRCDWTETLLNGEVISCFVIGGEMRLCLPQVLNSVLKNSIEEINSACTELQIFCSRCTPDQLAILKRKGILPLEATSCGLITKTDAERLVAALVDRNLPKLADLRKELSPDRPIDQLLSVAVFHDCFGKTRGLYRPDLYATPLSACIQCCECSALFPPHKFVAHSHQPRTRTCLWGFDSLNWRHYLLLAKDQSRANNCATDAKSPVTGCCAAHRCRLTVADPPDSQQQEELDRLMDEMRKRFDLHHHMARQSVAAVNAKLNSVSPVSPPAKRKEKEVSESAVSPSPDTACALPASASLCAQTAAAAVMQSIGGGVGDEEKEQRPESFSFQVSQTHLPLARYSCPDQKDGLRESERERKGNKSKHSRLIPETGLLLLLLIHCCLTDTVVPHVRQQIRRERPVNGCEGAEKRLPSGRSFP